MALPSGDEPVIVALATPWGHSALALVRASGPGCHALVRAVAVPRTGRPLVPGIPRRVDFEDGEGRFDDGIAWLQAGPSTSTGEDVAELTLHGNPHLVRRLLEALLAAGAEMAGPGAFTRRALEHGKVDLTQAEGIHQLVIATSRAGARAARRALDGETGAALGALRGTLVEAIAELEARLDVPGDETAALDDDALRDRLRGVAREARQIADGARAGHHLVHGARVALVGAVNAGKSSLINALVGRTRVLVDGTPGTTRDVVEVPGDLDGLAVTWLDTAGERDTDDPIEAAGIALARDHVEGADLLVVVLRARPDGPDATERLVLRRTADRARVVVLNGVDAEHGGAPAVDVRTVARTGLGVDALRAAVRDALVGGLPADAVPLAASLHQARGLAAMAAAVDAALEGWACAGVAVAADLLGDGVRAIDALTGADTREDVLDALFRRFCVGK